jgi:hypothetical protein
MGTTISGATGIDKVQDGTIVNADINSSAAIAGSKLSGIGKVLQVVNGTYGTQITSTSTTFTDTNLTASITPSATSSKILILVTQPLAVWDGVSSATSAQFKLFRDSTSIRHITAIGQRYPATHFTHTWMTTEYLDSPSSTSSITYKTQYKTYTSGAQVATCYGGATASITLMEIAG